MRRRIRKTFVTLIGFIVLITGIILIPYPGPGWLIVFAALGILSTEYAWAKQLLNFAKGKYNAWEKWIKSQNEWIQLSVSLFTLTVVVLTVWLLHGYGVINHFFNLGWDWVDSPLPVFHQ